MAKGVRGSDQFQIRLPEGMRDRIKAVADANNRSMNAEILATLEEAYPPPEGPAQRIWDLYNMYTVGLVDMADLAELHPNAMRVFKAWDDLKIFNYDDSPEGKVGKSLQLKQVEQIMDKRKINNADDIKKFITTVGDPYDHPIWSEAK